MALRTLLVVAALLAAPSHAQRHVERSRVQLLPVDVAAEVPAFKTYRDALQAAVAARDADRVLAMMHPEIAQGGLELALRQGGKIASSGATGRSGQAAIQRRPATTWHNSSDVKLRNAHLAVIARGKLLDYLLNDAHPDNGGKGQLIRAGESTSLRSERVEDAAPDIFRSRRNGLSICRDDSTGLPLDRRFGLRV